MNCGKIIKDMKKWIRIFNDRWYCRKSGENRFDESNRYCFINNAYFHHRNDGSFKTELRLHKSG